MEWAAGEYGLYCMAVKVSFFPCLFGGMRGCPQPCLMSPQKELGEVSGMTVMWQAVLTKRKESLSSPPPPFLSFFPFIASPFLPPGFDLGWGWGAGKSQQNFGLEKWLMTTFSSKSQWARQRRAWPKPQQCNWNYRASSRRKSCWTWLERHRERDGQTPPWWSVP